MNENTFIIDCPNCKAKVAAIQKGHAEHCGFPEESGEPFGKAVYMGKCPICKDVLVGHSYQIDFEGYDADEDRWSDIVRVFPCPNKAFASFNIPKVVRASLAEADKCIQVGAYTASCLMVGRAIEAVCRHSLHPEDFAPAPPTESPKTKHKIMLAEGLKKLKDKGVIDGRLHEWGSQLHAFRNFAAHPDDFIIDREDAEDIQNFGYAIVEYIYDLNERFEEFKSRQARKSK